MELGANLRTARTRRGLTVAELAAASGLSKGFVSQVENDKTSPSLDTLEKLAAALDMPLVELLSATPKQEVRPLVRRGVLGDVRRNQGRGVGAPQLREVGRNSGDLKVYVAELPPGGALGDAGHRHAGDETIVVLSGRVEAEQGGATLVLAEGDAVTWAPGEPHVIANRDSRPARLLIALGERAEVGLPLMTQRPAPVKMEPLPAPERPFRLVAMRRSQRVTGNG